jgi:UDP-glucose:(heptosyl)LPS alpha-1,3-glucosyltransferase
MAGLDVYYAADPCFEEKAHTLRPPLYRLSYRYRHFSAAERAVFAPPSHTQILVLAKQQQAAFIKHYATPAERFHLLPPGISMDRRAPKNAAEIRQKFRQEFNLGDQDLLLLQIGSGFKTKGLDRTLQAMASLPNALKQRTHLMVIGQDNPAPFERSIRRLGLTQRTSIFSGRDDIPRFLLGADLLIHPAYQENTGTVLLEAAVAGLPVLASATCGYAHYIKEADAGRVVPLPFEQQMLNDTLRDMLMDDVARKNWQRNGLNFAEHADIYSLHEHAADIILRSSP